MKLSLGIVGLPNVGKSTLFKLLTRQEVNIANYPFATIDPNIGVVPVADERLDKLAELSRSAKKIPAVIEFYDIAGLVKGANKGEGLGNQFLSHIREVNAIVHVVRCFPRSDIVHIEGGVDPRRDLGIVNTELALKDLETVERKLEKAESEARSGKKDAVQVGDLAQKMKRWLETGQLLAANSDLMIKCAGLIREMGLLTAKPQIFLLNGSPEDAGDDLKKEIQALDADFIIMNLAEAREAGTLTKKAYAILNLISFFTTGEDETRAWTIERGAKAPQAAGAIHTDFEKKFIRAEVIAWDKLMKAGGWNRAREKGWLRFEGKDYIVAEGDVMVIRHGA